MDVTSLAHWTMIDSFPVGEGPSKDEDGNHCLSWCTSKFTAQMMVVGCAKDHVAKVCVCLTGIITDLAILLFAMQAKKE